MNTNFEPVMEALFAVLSALPGFQTTGRRVIPWTEDFAQPALFLRRIGAIDAAQDTFTITTLLCEIWIYANAGQDPDATPDSQLATLEQTVREAFAPDADYGEPRFTLGGLVWWCRIEGRSDYAPGDIGPQAISRLAVSITLLP